jgi:outer membrane receptor for ferric coprogen and ferric-rhodotorulic acid
MNLTASKLLRNPKIWICGFRVLMGLLVLSFNRLAADPLSEAESQYFDVPAGAAIETLAEAAKQASVEFFGSAKLLKGVLTPPLRGEFAVMEAFRLMLEGTSIDVFKHKDTGVFAVVARTTLNQPQKDETTMESESRTPTKLLGKVAMVLSALVAVPAANGQDSQMEDEAYQLSPFIVETDNDIGFLPASSLAGGRMATDLKDTPIAYSVLTREFLDALNLFDSEEALSWTVGAYQPQSDVTNYRYFNNEAGSSIMSRGVQTTSPQRNFFQLGVNSDTYAQDRIDFSRGPNALLIGTGGLGGSVITTTKRAFVGRKFGRLRLTAGSWDNYRATLDYNFPVTEKFAVRMNMLTQTSDTWRQLEFDRRKGIHLAASYRPFSRTTIRAEYEWYDNERLTGRESMEDLLSGWDGVSVVASPIATIADADAKGLARNGSSTAPYLLFIPGENPNTITNWANSWKTVGGAANARVPIGGVFPASSSSLNINGGMIIGSPYDHNAFLKNAASRSPYFTMPTRKTVSGPNSATLKYGFEDMAVYLEHQQGDHFFFEIAAHHADTRKISEYIVARNANELMIDVNQTLPTGEANPNFLKPYVDSSNSHQYFDNKYNEIRAAVAAVYDGTRWGDFRANLIVGNSRSESPTYRLADVINRNPDIRMRSRTDQFNYRFYLDNPASLALPDSITLVDPVSGTSTAYDVSQIVDLNATTNNRQAETDYTYLQAAGNAKLFNGRLNLLAGVRRDAYTTRSLSVIGNQLALINSYPTDWDGRTIYYRPKAPNDYFSMTYVPKNAAGNPTGPETFALSRPRSNGVALPQYANDRFRDDYSAPEVDFNITTVTYGGVFHFLPWLSAYANFAESFNPPTSGLTLTGTSVPPGMSEGWDAGLRFSLKDGRISMSVGIYDSEQRNNSLDSSGSTRKYATIANANAVGDQSINGINKRGLAILPTPTFDFQDREASGFEIDLVANITDNWRMTFNYSDPEVFTTNTRQDEFAYLAANEATLRQVVLDAGVIIDGSNVATVDTSIAADMRSPDAADAASAWNSIQTFKATVDPTIKNYSSLPAYTANFYTDYRFTEGLLKNFRVGVGVQMFGKRSIGNRGADTIPDPSNPSRAIDDPDVDITTRVYQPSHMNTTATLNYQYTLKSGHVVDFNLSVRNLLDDNDLVYTGTGMRPPEGDISKVNRVATPIGFYYRNPRSYTLTMSIGF